MFLEVSQKNIFFSTLLRIVFIWDLKVSLQGTSTETISYHSTVNKLYIIIAISYHSIAMKGLSQKFWSYRKFGLSCSDPNWCAGNLFFTFYYSKIHRTTKTWKSGWWVNNCFGLKGSYFYLRFMVLFAAIHAVGKWPSRKAMFNRVIRNKKVHGLYI